MSLTILAVTCKKYLKDKAEACRQTWAKKLPPGTEVYFIAGEPGCGKPKLKGDVFWVDAEDDYEHLPAKTKWLCQIAIDRFPNSRIFKCDDDTYVRTDLLVKFASEHDEDYIGQVHLWKGLMPYGNGGAGYLLSQKAAKIIAENIGDFGMEDSMASRVLLQHGIHLTHCSLFNQQIVSPHRNWITMHHLSPEQMIELHKQVGVISTKML